MYALLPLKYLGISQGVNGSYSHQGVNAIDFGWKTGYDYKNLYAPFDCKVVVSQSNGVIAIESLEKVEWADGTKDYMTIITMHHHKLPKVSTIFKQNEIYTEMSNNGAPLHTHLEVQKGHYAKWTEIRVTGTSGAKGYIYPNTIEPQKALYMRSDAKYSPNPSACPYIWKVEPTDDYKALYQSELAKNKVLQKKLDRIEAIVNE